jgi:hypothetical protein
MINISQIKSLKKLSASKLPKIKRSVACRDRSDYLNEVPCFRRIINKAFPDNKFFVYVLWIDDNIVYVGQSSMVYQRWQSHKYRISYTHVSLLNFKDFKTMEAVEIRFIQKHRPIYNKKHNPDCGYAIID